MTAGGAPVAGDRPLTVTDLGQTLAEPARLRILLELLGGVSLPAGALAARVGLAPSTVSGHLARLADAGLVTVRSQGRRRLASLDRADVAEVVEAMSRLTGQEPVASLAAHRRHIALRDARSCYDHLAGRLAVALADWLLTRGWVAEQDGVWTVPADGLPALSAKLGLSLSLPGDVRRPLVRPCPDWTERRPHLAGRLGAALLTAMLDARWVRRRTNDRALDVTESGRTALERAGVVLAVSAPRP